MDYNAQYQAYLNTAETAAGAAAERCFNERSRVCEAARYSLFGGGKRVRAVLCWPCVICGRQQKRGSLLCGWGGDAALLFSHP